MKQGLFGQVLTGLTELFGITLLVTSTVAVLINQPSYALDTSFFCGESKYQGRTVPATYVSTQNGKKVMMLRWVSDNSFPPPWTPQRRCEEVSRRFQRSFDNGTLRYIITGVIKGQSVVCAVEQQGNACADSNVLFTLKPGTQPSAVLTRLLDTRGLAAGRVLNEAGGDDLVIDVDAYIRGIASQK